MKRTPLRRSGPIRGRKRPEVDAIPWDVAEQVRARSGNRCELDHPGCTGWGKQMHHRRLRKQGGEHSVANLIHLCVCGHEPYVHRHREWARRHGLILHAGDDPAVLVLTCPLSCEEDHR